LTADVLKSPDSLHLSAVLPGLSGEYIISGVVEFDDGRVISTPLHQPERVTLPRESSQLAHAELSRLTQERAQLEKRGSELAEESKRLRTSLRSAAGLEDVDRLYEKIAALEERLAELSALPGEGVTH
jgi:ubiquinone biosynthesis protein UbiJ